MTARRASKSAVRITPSLLRRWPLPKLDQTLGKEGRGKVLVVGGSEQIPGAVILSAIGALRAGAGTLQIATSSGVAPFVATLVPEARVIGLRQSRSGELSSTSCRTIHTEVARCDALLIGPGMMDPRAGVALLQHCVRAQTRATLVVDAAPLAAFHGRKPLPRRYSGGVIATPHTGEMAKLWGVPRERVIADPLDLASRAAARLGIIVALKGADTFVAAPDGRVFHNTAGNVGLGTSGSGDTLAGVIAGLCARGAEPLQAAVWGIYLHAKAGEILARKIAPLGFLARELLTEIPPLLSKLT
ncbi:MAG TPA: NAD(P)H-hydrate dehydratase [Polyangiaceae bacterium]|nr:NAD(P)H-hydrate dehydratase [Polyangiaceae bacterium]